MTITVYVFENENGDPDTFTTTNYAEADARARRYKMRLIAQEYEYSDSETIADYTGKGDTDANDDETAVQPDLRRRPDDKGMGARGASHKPSRARAGRRAH